MGSLIASGGTRSLRDVACLVAHDALGLKSLCGAIIAETRAARSSLSLKAQVTMLRTTSKAVLQDRATAEDVHTVFMELRKTVRHMRSRDLRASLLAELEKACAHIECVLLDYGLAID